MVQTRERTLNVVARLRERVASGQYPAGGYLPSERRLAAEMGVARNTLRGALAQLEQEGLVRRTGRRGVMVRDVSRSGVAGVVVLFLSRLPTEGAAPMSAEAMALLSSALREGSRADLQLQLKAMPSDGAGPLIEFVRTHQVPGVLFIECKDAGILSALRAEGIPYVVINQEFDTPGPATRVDFWSVGRMAAEHLLALGHRKLAVLSGSSYRHMYDRMVAGFRGRAAESEVYLDRSHVVRVASCSEASRAAALEWLTAPDRPTAIFCTRDVRAYGAHLAARELGIRIPEDLSLVGYDDITWPGQRREFLTTLPEPTEELGGAAIRMLISWIQTGEAPEDIVLTPDLVVRRSTGRPAEEPGVRSQETEDGEQKTRIGMEES